MEKESKKEEDILWEKGNAKCLLVKDYAQGWTCEFWIGKQGFRLHYGGTKAEAKWMAKQLKIAFANYWPISPK